MSTRLFDAGTEAKQAETAKQRRDEIRRRAAEADAALREAGMLDIKEDELVKMRAAGASDLSTSFSTMPAAGTAVEAIRYTKYRPPGSRWLIEYANVGEDVVFQLFPLKPPTSAWQQVIGLMIPAMDVVLPRSVQVRYMPPDETYQMKFYTVKVEKVASVPGWIDALPRILIGLAGVDAWA